MSGDMGKTGPVAPGGDVCKGSADGGLASPAHAPTRTVAQARAELRDAIREYGMWRSLYAAWPQSTWSRKRVNAEVAVNAAVDELITAVRAEAVASPVGKLADLRLAFDLSMVSVEGGE